MKIFIITEGGKDIGFGHVTRCVSLYQAFEKKGLIPEFIVNGDETIEDFLRDKNYKIFTWPEKTQDLFDIIKNADVVIVDSYLAGSELYKKISDTVRIAVYLDDNNRINYPKGIVVNGGMSSEKLSYIKGSGITYLLGSKYTPLRREFCKVQEKEIKEEMQSLMITFGGDDSRNMTPKVLGFLNKKYPGIIKKVIIGRGFQNIKEIEDLREKNTDLIYYPDANGMRESMLESDVAISAAGQTLYELARVGVPTIAIDVAENQLNNIKAWQSSGFIWYAGHWKNRNILEKIRIFIQEMKDPNIRKDKYQIGRKFVDGEGSFRIVNSLLNILSKR